MTFNRVLALSSSRVGTGGYLQTSIPVLRDFLGDKSLNIAFIPFATVNNNFEEYGSMVKSALAELPHSIQVISYYGAKSIIESADVIMVGGGNTFKLLHDIYECKLLDVIRDKVNRGTPYIGWSAGANIAGPTIGTTNDMPVIEPKSFNALGLLPFQINPHYTNFKLKGYNGETRDQRLEEFMQLNNGISIVGLPEGTALKLEENKLQFIGEETGVLFYHDNDKVFIRKEILVNEDLTFLL